MLARASTHAFKKPKAVSLQLPSRTRSAMTSGPLTNLRMLSSGPSMATGGIATWTRDPSARRASLSGDSASIRRPTESTMCWIPAMSSSSREELIGSPDDRHRRRRGVEDADQACDPMTGDVVQTCVSGRRLLRARLKQEDALVLVAAVDEDVAATLEVQASRGVSATRNEEFHRAHGPGGRARHVGAGGGVDAVPLIREVTARRSGGGGIPV